MKNRSAIWISLKAMTLFTVLLGIVYPALVMLIGQLLFYHQSNGSIVLKNNKIIGSMLIAQKFESDTYFTPRPSAVNYNPFPSGGSNLSATDKRLKQDFEIRRKDFIKNNFIVESTTVPPEMLFASGSGVDPHISKRSALLQLERISDKRNLDNINKAKLTAIIDSLSDKTFFGILGNESINVLELNLRLDELTK